MIRLCKEIWDTFLPVELAYKRIYILVFIWLLLVGLNYTLIQIYEGISTTSYFPFSVFSPSFQVSGMPYAIIFLLVLYFTIKYRFYSNIFSTYMLGVSLIVLGNMSLGNMELALVNPISGGDIQYYHDAIKIDSWKNWLSSFNVIQESLICHARTHPPGAVLIEFFLFMVSKNPLWISLVFLFLSSISIVLIYKIFIELGKDKLFSNKMAFLYVVIPSVNIYSLASLDAIIAMLANIVILAMIIIIECKESKRMVAWGIVSAASMTLVSLLTFGGIYLWAIIGAFSLYLFYFHNNHNILILFIGSLVLFLLTVVLLNQTYNYDYFESFFTASRIENKHGFMLFSQPLNYFVTRLEDVFEIAVFLSLGIMAFLTTIKYKLQNNLYGTFSLIAIVILLLMFLSGAYKTGETARACLFVVGFVLILLRNIPSSLLTSLISFAALQTILMQILGFYFW